MVRIKLSVEGREKVAQAAVFVTLAVLIGGLIRLQVFKHAELVEQSENNRIRVLPVVPSRGMVFDRDGRIIMDDRPAYAVSVVPAEEVKGVTVPRLVQLLGLDSVEVRRRISRNRANRYQPAEVKRDIPFEVVAELEEQGRSFPGISYQLERVRRYPTDLQAEAFTGYIGEVSEDDMKKVGTEDYRLGSMIGKKGLEKQYDNVLRGREGTEYIEVSAFGQIIGPYEGKEAVQPLPGAVVTLTVDNDLQRACITSRDSSCCGAIVAIDPRTGEVLAMTSFPGYDANLFSTSVPADMWRLISSDPTHPLLNRPLNGLYPPGSTAKFITVGAALEENLITPNTTLRPCYGGFQFGNRYFRCWEHKGHGALTAPHAIERSCDVFMYQLGIKLGVDELSRYYKACGFGRVTGIDIPGESPGLIPSSEYYDSRYGKRQWSQGLVLNNSIGQGETLVTPLQLAQFYCGLANNGIVYTPHLVKKITKPDGKVTTIAPTVAFRLPFSASTMAILREGLRLVVEGPGGTARSLRNPRYSVGGKTGTAQNPHGDDHSWFVGVAPLEVPEIVVCVLVENAGHGSEVAAPIAKKIIEAYMDKKFKSQAIAEAGGDGGR
jgi:penicillin-binding protein 2